MDGYFKRVARRTPTDLWINNVTLREAELALAAGAVGSTQNPSFVWRILNDSQDKPAADKIIDSLLPGEADDTAVLEELQARLVAGICEKFMPLFEKSRGEVGWVSVQGNPYRESCENIVRYGVSCRQKMPNVIVKIPATENGLAAMRLFVPQRVPMLATEVMSMDQAIAVCELYDTLTDGMSEPPVMYMAQITGIFDEHLQDVAKREDICADSELFYMAGVTLSKKIAAMMRGRRTAVRFTTGGARALHHFTEMVGMNGGVTINWPGYAEVLDKENPPVIDRFSAAADFAVIDELCESFEVYKKAYCPGSISMADFESFGPVVKFRSAFEDGWKKAVAYIAQRRKTLA